MNYKKPIMTNFQKVSPMQIQKYERYLPTAFDESLSILEKINKVIEYMNRIGELTNDVVQQWNDVMEWLLNNGLGEAVINQLNKWLEDGTIADLINQTIFDELNGKVDANTQEINEIKSTLNTVIDELENKIKVAIQEMEMASQNAIYQKKLFEAHFGFGGSEIFDGAEVAPQGMAYVNHNGQEKVFILSRVEGSTWQSNERQRITEFNLTENGSVVNHVSYSQPLNLSHQGLSGIVENGEIVLFAGMNTGSGDDSAKGYSKIVWKGSSTNDQNVTSYRLMGSSSSNHNLSIYNRGTPIVSKDGKFVITSTHTDFQTNQRYCIVFDRKQLENASNSLNVKPLTMFQLHPARWLQSHVVQDMASDGRYIYIGCSGVEPKMAKVIYIYTMNGQQIGYFHVDTSVGDYTDSELHGNSSLGLPTQIEIEGIDIRDNNNLIVLSTDVWESNGSYTKRGKVIHEITASDEGNVKPLNRGYINKPSTASMHLYGQTVDLSFPYGDAFQLESYDETTETFKNVLGFHVGNEFRFFDNNEGSDNEQYSHLYVDRSSGREAFGFRARNTLAEGGAINMYGLSDSVASGQTIVYSATETEEFNFRIQGSGAWRPGRDGEQELGTPTYRIDNIYATGTVTTSDRNAKQQIGQIPDEILDAWQEVNYVQFKYNDAVNKKGEENARLHIGVIAQQIYEVFEQHGIDAFKYGIVGKDSWEYQPETRDKDGSIIDEERQAGERWSIKPDECQFLEMALMRRELNKLKAGK